MIRKSMPSGHDPMGGYRFSKKIMPPNKRPPKGGQVIKHVFLSWQDNSLGNSRAASGFAMTISAVESGDLVSRSLNMRKEAAHNQQTAFQPSGNGMNPHASWLSLAAFGSGLNVDGQVKKSSSGAGAMAVRTASNKHSYSTSLITLSGYQSAQSQNTFVFRLK